MDNKRVSDDRGNVLTIEGGRVQLKLGSEGRIRSIGSVGKTPEGEKVYRKVERNEKAIFRTFNAFGFCYQAIKEINPDVIEVAYSGSGIKKGVYAIDIGIFNVVKKFLDFRSRGFELRVYVPIDQFEFTQ